MAQKTKIEWADATWSPLRARVKDDAAAIAQEKGYASLVQIARATAGHVGHHCEHVSPGCEHCYSGTNQARCLTHNGTGLPFDRRSRDLIDPMVDEKMLMLPTRWKKPRRIFVESQSDLFGEWYPDYMIDRVFAIAGMCDGITNWERIGGRTAAAHTMLILTKRSARMKAYCESRSEEWARKHFVDMPGFSIAGEWVRDGILRSWLGVSCEDQDTADERIPLLLQTPAAVRFVSYEPALGPVDFSAHSIPALWGPGKLDWVIVGGESGPGARPFDIAWARNTIRQCQAAGVAVFVKQLGAFPVEEREVGTAKGGCHVHIKLKDRKGGDMDDWQEDLRVREFPKEASVGTY